MLSLVFSARSRVKINVITGIPKKLLQNTVIDKLLDRSVACPLCLVSQSIGPREQWRKLSVSVKSRPSVASRWRLRHKLSFSTVFRHEYSI